MASLELRNGVWHLRWRDKRGKLRSLSTKIVSSEKNDILAQKKLTAFEIDLRRGKNPAPSLKIGGLLDDFLREYTVNLRKSIVCVTIRVEKHLRPWFGEMRADKLGADDWREYSAYRQGEGASNTTINLERAGLIRAYHLAKESDRIDTVPYLPRLKKPASNPLFIDRAEFEALCRHLPDYLRPFVRFAFLTGWRLGEIRQLQWRHVDFTAGEIRLDPGTTKNGDGRVFPMTTELRALLQSLTPRMTETAPHRHVAPVRVVVAGQAPTLTPFVFVRRSGKPIRYLYVCWRKAVKAIGKPGLLFRHMRNSAIVDMDQRGISRRVIMDLVGHRNPEMFNLYRRVGKADLDRARELMECSQSVRTAGNRTDS